MNRPEVILVAVISLLTLPFILFLPERASIVLMLLSFIVVVCEKQIRTNPQLMIVVMLGLLAHQGASLSTVYYRPIMSEVDAAGFHEEAKAMARSLQPGWFAEFGAMDAGSSIYIRFLAFSYYLLGDSKLLGQSLSVFAYTLTCVFLIKLAGRMGVARWQAGLAALYCLLPSAIFFPSTTLREAYQMLFFLLSIYYTFALRKNPTIINALRIVLAAIGLGLLHNGLVIYAILLVCFNFLWGFRLSIRGWGSKNLGNKIAGIVLLIGLIAGWVYVAGNFGGATRALMAGEGVDYASGYRERGGTEGRATYGGKLDTSSITAFFPSAINVFVLYMFAPFPWQVSSPMDIYAVFEAFLRLLLLYNALATWYRARGERRSEWGYMILCILSLEFLWATGTANWGTAIRHHLIAYGPMLLVGGPGLLLNLKSIFLRLTKRKQRRPRRLITIHTFPSKVDSHT